MRSNAASRRNEPPPGDGATSFPTATMTGTAGADAAFSLYHGDCRWWMDRFPAESVDCIFADPPYFLSNGGLTVSSGRAVKCAKGGWDRSGGTQADWSFHLSWIAACRRILKPSGTIWVSGTSHSIYQCGLTLQQLGFTILNEVVWYKPNAVPNLSCRVLTASHETLLWARKDRRARHTFNYRRLKEGDWSRDILKRPGKQMRSVWAIPPPGGNEKRHGRHPTQKPLDLLHRIVTASTNPGDIIVDPFSGSGTTGVAAVGLGRHYVGIDLDRAYLDLARRRMEAQS